MTCLINSLRDSFEPCRWLALPLHLSTSPSHSIRTRSRGSRSSLRPGCPTRLGMCRPIRILPLCLRQNTSHVRTWYTRLYRVWTRNPAHYRNRSSPPNGPRGNPCPDTQVRWQVRRCLVDRGCKCLRLEPCGRTCTYPRGIGQHIRRLAILLHVYLVISLSGTVFVRKSHCRHRRTIVLSHKQSNSCPRASRL